MLLYRNDRGHARKDEMEELVHFVSLFATNGQISTHITYPSLVVDHGRRQQPIWSILRSELKGRLVSILAEANTSITT